MSCMTSKTRLHNETVKYNMYIKFCPLYCEQRTSYLQFCMLACMNTSM